MGAQRVVITGMGAVSPYGEGCKALLTGLGAGQCALAPFDPREVAGLSCRVAGRVPPLDVRRISRELRRSMSPMSCHATLAAWEALAQAGLRHEADMPPVGVSIGSTLGGPAALQDFFAEYLGSGGMENVRTTTFFKVMGHTVASNVAMACGARGRLLAPAAACASGLMAIGLGYECIAAGRERLMLCGGADEFHALTVATFDRMQAATPGEDPLRASLPFHRARQGIVVSEGAGVLLLESLDSALARNAPILAEICGFASQCSPGGIAAPQTDTMRNCMEAALDDAALSPRDIALVNAHATGTLAGDSAEGQAIAALFGPEGVAVNSLKGHMGHSLAASGALESMACVDMLQHGYALPTLHLDDPDPACGALGHVRALTPLPLRHCLKNAFALGGVYCSLVLRRWASAPTGRD